ncbi:MAG: 3-isopropylmalate dehydratase small subunit, partial [Acidobacteria bacterium]
GFRAVISTAFADIFCSNCLKNGLLPIVVPAAVHRELFLGRERDPRLEVGVDLARQRLELPEGRSVTFPIDGFSKKCLLEGLDELGYLVSFGEKISAFEAAREP